MSLSPAEPGSGAAPAAGASPAPGGSRRADAAPRLSPVSLAVLAVAALLVLAAIVVEATAAPVVAGTPEPVPQGPAEAGVWYCPAVAGEGEEATLSVAAAGEEPSTVTVVRHTPDGPVADEPVEVGPRTQVQRELSGDEARQPVAVRWSGGPVVATWRVDGERTAAAPCAPGPSTRWHVSGLDTAEGSRSTLHLFNPYTEDAVARVRFATPQGAVDLVLTDTILVPAGSSTPVDVNEFRPEEPDLGAVVQVETGRLVAAGEVVHDPNAGTSGPTGRTLIPAARAPGTLWGVGFARVDDGSSSWLSVMNPGDREAVVAVRPTDPLPDGPLVGEVAVPPGGIVRIGLDEASAAAEFAVAVESVNEVPVVVTRTTSLVTGDGREGVATALAQAPATAWAVAGGGTEGRAGRLAVLNPGGRPVTVDVVTEGAPAAWSDIVVPPNGRAVVELADAGEDRAAVPVTVRADGPVVPELRSFSTSGSLRLFTLVATPSEVWQGPPTRLAVRQDPGLGTTPLRPAPTAAEDPLPPLSPETGTAR